MTVALVVLWRDALKLTVFRNDSGHVILLRDDIKLTDFSNEIDTRWIVTGDAIKLTVFIKDIGTRRSVTWWHQNNSF